MRATCLIHHIFLNVIVLLISRTSSLYNSLQSVYSALLGLFPDTLRLSSTSSMHSTKSGKKTTQQTKLWLSILQLYDFRVCKKQAAINFINLLTILMDFYAIIPGRYTGRICPVGRKRSSIYPARKLTSSTRL